jgi:Lrp/AsnC family leucine-responsive transcriptional regulator
MAQYQQILLNKLGTIESLSSLKSSFVMDEVKHEYGISL